MEPVHTAALEHKGLLSIWEKEIQIGGTRYNKINIDSWLYDRFLDTRKEMKRTLQEWDLAAANQLLSPTFEFTAMTVGPLHIKPYSTM